MRAPNTLRRRLLRRGRGFLMGHGAPCARASMRARFLDRIVRPSIYIAPVLFALGAAPAAALTIRTVALTGDLAPGTGGATYDTFGPVVLDLAGEAAFTATLTLGGAVVATNDLGLWSEGSGALALVERRGSPAV